MTQFLKLLLAVYGLSFSFFLNAQMTIQGSVTIQNEPLEFGNIMVLDVIDSSLIMGAFIENGSFELKLNQESVLLEIEAVGYQTYSKLVTKSDLDFKVDLSPKEQLDGMSITASRPVFEQSQGNTIINVDHTILSTMSTTTDLFQKSPGIVMTDEGVTVVGSGAAQIYIGNQRITPERLSAIPVAQIDRIEIVKNPGSQYDAEGQAVIIVHLKENGSQGYQASILQHYTKAFYHLYFADLNLNIQSKKWSIMANYNNNLGSTGTRANSTIDINTVSDPYSGRSTFNEKNVFRNVANYALGLSFKTGKRSSITAEYNGHYHDTFIQANNKFDIVYDTGDELVLDSRNGSENLNKMNTVSLNYNLKTDTLGGQLFVGANYTSSYVYYRDLVQEDRISENNQLVEGLTTSEGLNRNDLYTFQVDQNMSLFKKFDLDVGVKFNSAELNSDLFVNSSISDSMVFVDTSAYLYSEDIFGSYITLGGTMNKWSYTLGLRAEYSDALANKIGESSPYYDRKRWNVFPSASLRLKGKEMSWDQSYSMRVTRPSYRTITPFFYYMNALTAVTGNPAIQQTFTHSVESKLSVKMASLSVGHVYSINPTLFINRVEDETETNVIQNVNIDQLNRTFVQLALPLGVKSWESYNMVNLSFNKYKDADYVFRDDLTRPKLYLYTYQSLNVKDWMKIELIGEYQSAFTDGSRELLSSGALNIGASKTFGKDKQWYVQLFFNDIFQTSQYRILIGLNENETDWRQTNDTRFLRCLVKYKFGKLREVNYQAKKINDDALMRNG